MGFLEHQNIEIGWQLDFQKLDRNPITSLFLNTSNFIAFSSNNNVSNIQTIVSQLIILCTVLYDVKPPPLISCYLHESILCKHIDHRFKEPNRYWQLNNYIFLWLFCKLHPGSIMNSIVLCVTFRSRYVAFSMNNFVNTIEM